MGGKTIQVSGFPPDVSAENVKDLLELTVGTGNVYAVKLRPPKIISANSRSFAIVQFQTEANASLVENAAQSKELSYGGYYLKARPAERDIVPRPRTTMFKLQGATLHLGCLLNGSVLSVLWSEKDVSVDFGFAMKKIDFCLLYKSKKYKLELSYESIWEIQLHSPLGSRKKFLLIQVILYLGNTSLCMLEQTDSCWIADSRGPLQALLVYPVHQETDQRSDRLWRHRPEALLFHSLERKGKDAEERRCHANGACGDDDRAAPLRHLSRLSTKLPTGSVLGRTSFQRSSGDIWILDAHD